MKMLDWKDIALVAIGAALVGVLVLRGHGDIADKIMMLVLGPVGLVALLKGRKNEQG